MARLELNAWGGKHEITLKLNNYIENGNLAIEMICWDDEYPEPWSILTVNLGARCMPNKAFVDTNNNLDIERWIIANKLGKPTGRVYPSGFCVYPEYEFDMEEVQKYVE